MKPKIDVSVIIPAFNAQDTIDHLVHGLLSEKTLSMEVIVVDETIRGIYSAPSLMSG